MSTVKTNPVIRDKDDAIWVKLGVSEGLDVNPSWAKYIEQVPGETTIWLSETIGIRVDQLKQVTLNTHSVLFGRLVAVSGGPQIEALRIIENTSYADYSVIASYDNAWSGIVFRHYLLQVDTLFPEWSKALRGVDGDLIALLNDIFPTWA